MKKTTPPRIERVLLAEDEIAKEVVESYNIETFEQLITAASASQADTFWPYIEKLLEHCNQVLEGLGLPHADRGISVRDDGSWSNEFPTRGPGDEWFQIRMELGYSYVLNRHKDFSEAWYAATVGSLCFQALAVKGKPGVHALNFALRIGQRCSEWEWRLKYKPSIVTGRKQRRTLKIRRDAQNSKMKFGVELRRKAIEKILSETRLKSGEALAMKIKNT